MSCNVKEFGNARGTIGKVLSLLLFEENKLLIDRTHNRTKSPRLATSGPEYCAGEGSRQNGSSTSGKKLGCCLLRQLHSRIHGNMST